MVSYFPRYFSSRAIYTYFITLALVSVLFMNYALPLQFMLFGIIPVLAFFVFSSRLTLDWQRLSPQVFKRRIFLTALVIRLVYVVFIYFYYIEMTGEPFAYHRGDEELYHGVGSDWQLHGFDAFQEDLKYVGLSDSGYCWWVGIVYSVFGVNVLPLHVLKAFIDALSCVLFYNLAKRNFGESAGRMAAVFYVLMPNMWYYCGVTLKETEMTFMVLLFAERSDQWFRSPKIKLEGAILPVVCILLMFTFRTALAAVMVAAFVAGLILTNAKQLQIWKKVLYSLVFAVWMAATVGVEMIQETQELWSAKAMNQTTGYEWRSETNSFAKYASAAVFAPIIFTLPFSSMVATPDQENQMMMNGANFIKNIMSGFTIFAVISMIFSGEWRRHVFPLALTAGYLLVLTFSNFAHSERFHFPVLALELMFAAYGVSLMRNKHKRWFVGWIVVIGIANIVWSWIKLSGRGML